jgi:hypothetical protein
LGEWGRVRVGERGGSNIPSEITSIMQPEAEFSEEIQTKVFRIFLLIIHCHLYTYSFALRIYFFKLTQSPTVSTV